LQQKQKQNRNVQNQIDSLENQDRESEEKDDFEEEIPQIRSNSKEHPVSKNSAIKNSASKNIMRQSIAPGHGFSEDKVKKETIPVSKSMMPPSTDMNEENELLDMD